MSEISDDIMDESVDAFEVIEMTAESVGSSVSAGTVAADDDCYSDSHETAADYGNGEFLKLRDCYIDVAGTEFDREDTSTDSWHVYTRYARFYDLIQLSSIEKQFTSNVVDVRSYGLCSNDIKALSRALARNERVTVFDLSGNELAESASCCHLADLLAENRTVERLVLSRCKIGAAGAAELARVFGYSALKSLDLSYNRMGRAGLESVFDSLQTNACLQELDVSDNGIQSECAADVISAFVELNDKLETLNLSRNFLNKNTDLSRLVRSLSVNETLRVLILRWNGISGEVNANAFKNLMIRTNGLKVLDLGCNDFKNVGKTFGQAITRTTGLEHLDLSDNPLTADDVIELLKSIVEPTSLLSLALTHVMVDEKIENAVSKVRSRMPDFDIRLGLRTGVTTEPVDLQTLYLQRFRYLGLRSKKKKDQIDIGQVLLKMKNEGNLEPMKRSVFLSTFEKLKINGATEVINELAKVFKDTNKKVDVALMVDKYLKLYPDTGAAV